MVMPNLPLPTLGGKVFWTNVRERNGWKLQQNMFTNHYRILDPQDVRRDWGQNYDELSKTFDIFSGY